MQLIIISPPQDLPDEAALVGRILRHTAATFHLRKPGQSDGELAEYLKRIHATLHCRIMVHGHRRLLDPFALKGIHFTEKERLDDPPGLRQLRQERPDCRLSTAFHRISDIPEPDGLCDYLFLSPIFDSISKPGYRAAFDHGELKRLLARTGHSVIALGGIDVRRVVAAAALGFKGIAVLGAVWNVDDPEKAAERLSAVCRGL